MKKYAHIKDGNVVIVLDYKMTSKFNENNIIEFNIDEIGMGNFVLRDEKIVVDNSMSNKSIDIEYKKGLFNQERNKELKDGFVISGVFMNEDIIKTMAVQFNIAEEDENIEWIDINDQTVTFTKVKFGGLIKEGSQKVKEIYFKYRVLKNKLEEA